MKAVVSNRIMLHVDKELKEQIVNNLTYRINPRFNKTGAGPEIIKTFSRVKEGIFSIPVGRFDLIPDTHEIIDKRVTVPVEFPEFKYKLRDSQQAVYDDLDDNCIVNAPVSWGKTFAAIAMATKLKQKTLVLTHTTMLRDQWISEVDKTLGIRAGKIGSGVVQMDSPIVIANVQTATKMALELNSEFGTVIVDECHHTPATTFSNILDKSKARYKIGLSGTLERKDSKHILFNDYFGYNIYKPEAENYMVPEVVIVRSDIVLPGGQTWAHKITELENFREEYRNLVVELTDSAIRLGHKVLTVGSRVEFLNKCAEQTVNPMGCITGKMTNLDDRLAVLEAIGNGDLYGTFGTCSIFAEGISQNDLSCLILATPINNDPMLTQLIGRIVRLKEGKKTPLIIDINLQGEQAERQAKARLSHYIRKGYKIRVLNKLS